MELVGYTLQSRERGSIPKGWKLVEERTAPNGEVQRVYMKKIKKRIPWSLLIVLLAIAAAFGLGLWVGGMTGHNRAECEWSSAIQLWTDMGLGPQDPDAMMKERIYAFKKDLEADRLRRIQEKSR